MILVVLMDSMAVLIISKNIETGILKVTVAKMILQAIMADNPDFRHVVGKDAAMMLEERKNMSDVEFQNLIKKQINL